MRGGVIDDLEFAARRLGRSPGFTAVAVVTLALAIGANAAIFSIADAVLFRPFPYEDPNQVFILQMLNRQTGQAYRLTPYEYLQTIEAHHSTVGDVGVLESSPFLIVETPEGAERVATAEVTANYFAILGVRPARGRVLNDDDGRQTGRPAMLSYASWQHRFGGDEHIVGRSAAIGGSTIDIVGVLPAGFMFPTLSAGRAEIVTLMRPLATLGTGGTFHPIVRLQAGIPRSQAQSEMDELIRPLAERDPRTATTGPAMFEVRTVLYPVARTIMLLLVAGSTLVLLIGCANLANMLLVRTTRQERDSAVRTALGASSLRVIRPIVFESLIIGTAGAGLALLVTWWGFESMLRLVPRVAYGQAPVGVDSRVALIALGMGLLSSFAFAAVPAWRASRLDVQVLLQGRHRASPASRGWLRHPLVALQVGAAVVLVYGAMLAGRAFLSVLNVPLGFDPAGVVTVQIWPSDRGSALRAFYVRGVDALARRSDVLIAGAIGSMPLDSSAPDQGIMSVDGTPVPAGIVHVLPGYFESAGIRLVRGRLLNRDDVLSGFSGAILSEAAAAALFPRQDPLGASFTSRRGRRFTVVGVVSDVRKSLGPPRRELPPAYVIPGDEVRGLTMIARMRPGVSGEAVLADVKREIGSLAPRTPISVGWWVDDVRGITAYRNPRFQSVVLGAFAVLALGLTALGIFGVMAFLVTARTREMGVRMALGATPRSLVRLVLRQVMAPVVVGLVFGLLATSWLARLAETQLFVMETRDPSTFAGAAAVVVVAALAAGYAPARHAARVDPIVALRAH